MHRTWRRVDNFFRHRPGDPGLSAHETHQRTFFYRMAPCYTVADIPLYRICRLGIIVTLDLYPMPAIHPPPAEGKK